MTTKPTPRILDRDDARLALWKAISNIKIGNRDDDKLIVAELAKLGFAIAAIDAAPSPPQDGDVRERVAQPWIEWSGGQRPVSEDQLVEVLHPGGTEPSLLMRAGSLEWEHRPHPLGEDKLHPGAIVRYRLGSALKIEMRVGSNGHSSTHFEQLGAAMDPAPLLEQAIAALEQELASLGGCPIHQKPALPSHSEAIEQAARYYELLYAVSMKHEGETRHETALRYIRQAERGGSSAGVTQQQSAARALSPSTTSGGEDGLSEENDNDR